MHLSNHDVSLDEWPVLCAFEEFLCRSDASWSGALDPRVRQQVTLADAAAHIALIGSHIKVS